VLRVAWTYPQDDVWSAYYVLGKVTTNGYENNLNYNFLEKRLASTNMYSLDSNY